jgi:hypothetical protein
LVFPSNSITISAPFQISQDLGLKKALNMETRRDESLILSSRTGRTGPPASAAFALVGVKFTGEGSAFGGFTKLFSPDAGKEFSETNFRAALKTYTSKIR